MSHCNTVKRVKVTIYFKKKEEELGMRKWMVSLTIVMRLIIFSRLTWIYMMNSIFQFIVIIKPGIYLIILIVLICISSEFVVDAFLHLLNTCSILTLWQTLGICSCPWRKHNILEEINSPICGGKCYRRGEWWGKLHTGDNRNGNLKDE